MTQTYNLIVGDSLKVDVQRSGTYTLSEAPVIAETRVTQRDLNSDVFNAKVDTLVDLWLARYDHNWVDVNLVMTDKFYELVYKRLRALGELEAHYLTDRSVYVCRVPE